MYVADVNYTYETNSTNRARQNPVSSLNVQATKNVNLDAFTLSVADMSNLTGVGGNTAYNIINAFAPVLGQNALTGVLLDNVTISLPYGEVAQNGEYVNAGNVLNYFALDKNHILKHYQVKIIKAVPPLNLTINGMHFLPSNNTAPESIHIPIIHGRLGLSGGSTYPLQVSMSSALLNGLELKYSIVDTTLNITVANGTVNASSITHTWTVQAPITDSFSIRFATIGNANYTAVDPNVVPTNIIYYVQVALANGQTSNTPAPFQQTITVNSLTYNAYEANDLSNIEFFYTNGTIVPSWLESGNSNTVTNTIYWLNITKGIPASSNAIVYMGFAGTSINLFNTQTTGEAPQLSGTYGQYDDGVNVFDYYRVAPASTAGWTVAGTAGATASAPTGSHFSTQDAYYVNSVNGDYMYSQVPGLTTNEIITFWVYSTGLGNLFFLTSSGGSGQMGRLDTRGGGDYSGLAATTSWTSWAAPSGLDESPNTWYKYDIEVTPTTANAYIGSNSNGLSTLGTFANSRSVSNNGNYIGLVGDALGATYITYWNGLIFRAYPPGGVMPSASFGPVQGGAGVPSLGILPATIAYGDNSVITATGNPNTDTVELFMNGNLVGGPSTGTITYTFNSLSPGLGAGAYTFNAYDENTLKSNIGDLTVNKAAPTVSLPNFPQSFIYTGSPVTVAASINTINDQLPANDFVNGAHVASFNTQNTFTETNAGTYYVVANTIGNSNYTPTTVSNTLLICPGASSIPANIVEYSCVVINNGQAGATPAPFQQVINLTESTFSPYLTYNGNVANFEYFYANGNIVPAWIESNSSGKLITWAKTTGIPGSSSNQIYLGFAQNTINLLSSSGTAGIGEAPQLSGTYGQYDDGADVFNAYLSGSSLSGWTTAGTAGQSSSAPSGNPAFGTDAFYANGASGDYLHTTAPQSNSMIIEFYGYTANLQDLFFLASSTGSGQMLRDGNGGGWYGIASTSSWTSWTAPPDTGVWSNEWVTIGIVVVNSVSNGYLSVGANPYGSEIGNNPTNQYTASNNGNYMGLVGDGAGGSTVQYWSGIITRAYPPGDVMPSYSFTSPTSAITCSISLSPGTISFSTLAPGSTFDTNQLITDTNGGSTSANVLVFGGNWISGPLSFGVSNTLWNPASLSAYGGNALSGSLAATNIIVGAASSNNIYFGLGAPAGVGEGTYTQNIIVENQC